AKAEVTTRFGYPITYNHANACAYASGIVDRIDGLTKQNMLPVMGGEDFSFYSERIPAMFLALGVRPQDRETYPDLHQSDYDFADGAIPLGILLYVEVARQFAGRWKS
ncbi:MAG: M20/M25/M40 family metallo-hydrolase, partial [Candidatus Latescibacterota bacterium]|nr:M20/M25/M40 family metallo-hydrolase [Candidatus Latescibacterota bacterium]